MSLHGKRKEIYKYEAPWTVYAMNWSVRPDKRFRLALGSFVEEYNNKVTMVMGGCVLICVWDPRRLWRGFHGGVLIAPYREGPDHTMI